LPHEHEGRSPLRIIIHFSSALRHAAREPSAERNKPFFCLPGIYVSARATRLGNMPGYYQPSRWGGTGTL
jgi:hypothetical protein